MKVAVVQMNSGSDSRKNQEKAESFIRQAAKDGAELVALPENFLFRGSAREMQDLCLKLKPITLQFNRLAQELKIRLLLGSVPEPTGDRGKVFNTSIFILPTGEVPVRYKKLHLFSAMMPDGREINESRSLRGGNRIQTFKDGEAVYGFTICYDLRFPELFRIMLQSGANLFFVPANFTKPTGTAHWHTLIRARAIENLSFVVAPAQCGFDSGNQVDAFGHSMVVSPWGDILLEMGEDEGMKIVDVRFEAVTEARKKLPVISHIRTDLIRLETRDRRAEAEMATQSRPGGR